MKTVSFNGIGEQKLWRTCCYLYQKSWVFFSGADPKLVRRSDWIWWRPFFFVDHLISAGKLFQFLVKTFFFLLNLTEKPPQSDSRLMKIYVKFVYCCFHLSKKPPLPLCEILATRLALVNPLLLHGIIIWGATYPTYLQKFKSLQNRAIRAVVGAHFRDLVNPYYFQLKILVVDDVFKFEVAKFV